MSPRDVQIPAEQSTAAVTNTAVLAPAAAHVAFVMELTLAPLLLPTIQNNFALTTTELAWVFNAYSIAVALGVFLGGFLGDRIQTSRLFCFGVACFLAGSLGLSIASDVEALVLGRLLQGLGAGIFSPLVPLLITRAAPDRPGRALILWGSLAGYIAALGPLAYGVSLGEADWRYGFAVIALIASGALLLAFFSATTDTSERNKDAPHYLEVFKAGRLWLTLLYVFVTYGAITYFAFRLPLWLTENGYSAPKIGLFLSVMWLSFSGASTVLRNKVDEAFLRIIVVAAPGLIALGLALSLSTDEVLIAAASVLVGAGLACSNSPSTQLILRHTPQGLSALSTSLDIALARLGGIVLVAMMTTMQGGLAETLVGLMLVLSAACAVVITRQSAPQ